MQYLVHSGHFSFNIRKLLLFDLISNFESEWDLNQSEFSNNNSGDVASLVEGYCSLIIRASQFSPTTRNLVPRFKRGSKGERIWLRNSNESSRSWLSFSKRSIHYVDVSISLLNRIMMKSASFLEGLHRTYERIKGEHSGRTDLGKVDYLVDNVGEGGRK